MVTSIDKKFGTHSTLLFETIDATKIDRQFKYWNEPANS